MRLQFESYYTIVHECCWFASPTFFLVGRHPTAESTKNCRCFLLLHYDSQIKQNKLIQIIKQNKLKQEKTTFKNEIIFHYLKMFLRPEGSVENQEHVYTLDLIEHHVFKFSIDRLSMRLASKLYDINEYHTIRKCKFFLFSRLSNRISNGSYAFAIRNISFPLLYAVYLHLQDFF